VTPQPPPPPPAPPPAAPPPASPVPSAQAASRPVRPARRGPDPGARWARLLWRVGGSVVAVAALAMGTFSTVSQLAHEEHAFQLTFDEPVTVLDVQVDSGAVRVVGGGGPGITVTAQVSDGLWATEHSQAVEGDRLVLRGRCPLKLSDFCHVDYTVEVPADVAVVARAHRDGRISVTGVDAPVDAATDNGTVEVDGLSGDLQLGTSNGSIAATNLASPTARATADNGGIRLSFVVPPTTVAVRSHNGSVQVVLPDTPVAYAIDADTSFGSVDTPIRTDPTSDRTISARTSRGSVSVRYSGG
jgi:hypothetical protein